MFLLQQLAFGEDLDMFGDGLSRRIESFGDGARRHGVQGHQRDDRSAGGVGYGLKYIATGLHIMQLSDCKYTQLFDCAKKNLFDGSGYDTAAAV